MRTYALGLLLLAGCAGSIEPETKVVFKTEVVKEIVQVPCKVKTPAPPDNWAMDTVQPTDTIFVLVSAALAEIEQRIGYEKELTAALVACQ